MAITVANLIAQVGADLSQFRIGMNEVDARLNLVAVREKQTVGRIQAFRDRAASLAAAADQTARQRAGINLAPFQAEVAAKTAQYQQAAQKLADAAAKLQRGMQQPRNAKGQFAGAPDPKVIAQLTKELDAASKAEAKFGKAAETASKALEAQRNKAAALAAREARQRNASAAYSQRATEYDEEGQALREVARRYAARLAQNANEHRIRAANAVAAESTKAGLAIGGTLAVGEGVGNDFNQMITTAAHNTSLGAAGVQEMIRAVKELGVESGVEMDKLADSYRKIENYGYGATDATKILTAAMKASVAYGSDMSDTTEVLTKALKEFGIPATSAEQAMGVMVATSKKSSKTMEELTEVYGKMSATSSNLGISMLETSAAFITFTRHGLDGAEAATQFRNDINKIINPSAKVVQALKNVGKQTGVDLVKDFSSVGIRAKGLGGVWADIEKAADRLGVKATDLAVKLFPLQRGQLGAAISTGTGMADWASAMKELRSSVKDGIGLQHDYDESLAQTNQQFARLKNAATVAASSVSTAFAPAVQYLVTQVDTLAKSFNGLGEGEKTEIIRNVALAAGVLLVAGYVGKLIVGINALNQALILMGASGNVIGMTGLSFITSPAVISGVILLAAAIGALYVAYKSYQQLQNSDRDSRRDTIARTQATLDSTRAEFSHQQQIAALVTEYQNMHDQAVKTHKPIQGMQETLDKISTLAPELIDGYNAQGHALGLYADAAQNVTDKLIAMAVAARASEVSQRNLQLAQLGEQMNEQGHQVAQLRIQAADLGGLHHRRGGPITGGDPTQIANVNAQLREATGTLEQTWQKYKNLQNSISDTFKIPDNAEAARSRGSNQLGQDLVLLTQRYKEAKNAVVEYERAHKHPAGDDYAGLLIRRTQAAKQLQVVQGEIKTRESLMGDPYGANKYATASGNDKLAGIYDKDKKSKKAKENEQDKLGDDYQRYIEGLRQQMFDMQNLNADKSNSDEVKARWEIMEHGLVTVNGAVKKLSGSFINLSDAEKNVAVETAKAADKMRIMEAQTNKYQALLDTNREKSYTLRRTQSGKKLSAQQIEQLKLQAGDYGKEYGDHAIDAFASNMKSLDLSDKDHSDDAVARIKEQTQKKATDNLEVYHQVLKEIMDDQITFTVLGKDAAEELARNAQASADAADGAKEYDSIIKGQTTTLDKLKIEYGNFGELSEATLLGLELQTEQYRNLTQAQRDHIIETAKEIDHQKQLNDAARAHEDITQSLKSQVEKSADTLRAVYDPEGAKRAEFSRQEMDKYDKAHKGGIPATDRSAVQAEVDAAYSAMEANNKLALKLEEVQKIMDDVKKSTSEMTDSLKINTDGVKISNTQWNELSKGQQQIVLEFQRLVAVKTEVDSMLKGVEDLFSKTLDNIKQKGFKNFFADIISGFDDMLFQLANKWVTSQFAQLINGGLGNLLTGLLGGTTSTASAAGDAAGLIGGGLGAIFGMGTPIASDGGGLASTLGSFNFGGFLASGGPAWANGSYIVGENGPEIFTPRQSGVVTPNGSIGGNTTVHVHVYGVSNPQAFQQSSHQVMQSASRAIQATQRR